MPKTTRRTEKEVEARENVRESMEVITSELASIEEEFGSMNERDQTKIGITVSLYDLDKSMNSVAGHFGSTLIAHGVITKLYEKNLKAVKSENNKFEELLGL